MEYLAIVMQEETHNERLSDALNDIKSGTSKNIANIMVMLQGDVMSEQLRETNSYASKSVLKGRQSILDGGT